MEFVRKHRRYLLGVICTPVFLLSIEIVWAGGITNIQSDGSFEIANPQADAGQAAGTMNGNAGQYDADDIGFRNQVAADQDAYRHAQDAEATAKQQSQKADQDKQKAEKDEQQKKTEKQSACSKPLSLECAKAVSAWLGAVALVQSTTMTAIQASQKHQQAQQDTSKAQQQLANSEKKLDDHQVAGTQMDGNKWGTTTKDQIAGQANQSQQAVASMTGKNGTSGISGTSDGKSSSAGSGTAIASNPISVQEKQRQEAFSDLTSKFPNMVVTQVTSVGTAVQASGSSVTERGDAPPAQGQAAAVMKVQRSSTAAVVQCGSGGFSANERTADFLETVDSNIEKAPIRVTKVKPTSDKFL